MIVKEKEQSFISISLQLQHWKNKDNDILCQLCFLSLQWNLHTPDIPYRGHLCTTDFLFRKGWNNTQTLVTKPIHNGHFIANTSTVDITFRSQITLLPRTDFSIADTSNVRHFLQEMYIHFTFDNVLQFRLSFLGPLLFYFLASLMSFSVPWKCRDFQSVFISMVDVFSSCKDVQSAMGQG